MSNQLFTNYDVSKIFVWDNHYITGEYTNSSGSAVTLAVGTIVGRVHATGKILPLLSTATDGSKWTVGFLADAYTVAAGATVNVGICVSGGVVQDKIVLNGSDTLDTVIDTRRLRDRIPADTLGVRLVPSTELSGTDNA